ncbi:type VII secretion-associated protein [Corynebacterium breve]|uniref:Type VII secretion-associated protein n=1 Tax=Corynebacterium breve TaxID=3049799 RepID=A0ABY8VGA8_9CORY|nr:type VII secretion-associated protein [Corynebacterium breve]WIM68137.1 type VII secretion-associated protein [Corynebacterium breve]
MTTITVVIHPALTIIEADRTYYRYDKPTADDVADFCCTVVDNAIGGHHVVIQAEETTAHEFAEACRRRGFIATAEPLIDDSPAPPEPETSTEEFEPVDEPMRPSPLPVLGIAALVVVVIAAGAWLAGPEELPVEPPVVAQVSEPVREVTSAPPSPIVPVEESIVLEQNGLSVTLPLGFQLEADGEMWRAQGEDPGFRLQLAADDLYGLPAEELFNQVERELSEDPSMTLIRREANLVEYHQLPGDGSEARWFTWVADGQQLSVGCHTQFAPTTVQQATCAMAYESAVYAPESPEVEAL